MLVDTRNLVSAESFRRDLDKYVATARSGHGPVAVMQDNQVVGVWMAPEEYEALFGVAVRDLLAGRMTGPTVSQQQARTRIRQVLAKRAPST